MKTKQSHGWVFYRNDTVESDPEKSGKWMYFFENKDFVSKLCIEAIRTNVVDEVKYSDAENGVACFYLNYDDIDGHKRVLMYFMDNNLIPRTRRGKFTNISFKLNTQTNTGQYGDHFQSDIRLSDFYDLNNDEWVV